MSPTCLGTWRGRRMIKFVLETNTNKNSFLHRRKMPHTFSSASFLLAGLHAAVYNRALSAEN
jgi:hypothetical protein